MPNPKTTTRPCKAKDPNTCPYHGTQLKLSEAVTRLASNPTDQDILKQIFVYQEKLKEIEKRGLSEEDLVKTIKKPVKKDYSFTKEDLTKSIFKKYDNWDTFTNVLLTNARAKKPTVIKSLGTITLVEHDQYAERKTTEWTYSSEGYYNDTYIFEIGGRNFRLIGAWDSWDNGNYGTDWEDLQEVEPTEIGNTSYITIKADKDWIEVN